MNRPQITWPAQSHGNGSFPGGTMTHWFIHVGQNLSDEENEGANK